MNYEKKLSIQKFAFCETGKSDGTHRGTEVGWDTDFVPFKWSEAEWERHGYLKYRHSGSDIKYLGGIQ